jgi:integrase
MSRFKPRDQACVKISGKRIYLGKWGSAEAERRYQEVVGKHLLFMASQPVAPPKPGRAALAARPVDPATISMVAHIGEAYIAWAASYYRKGGRRTSEALIAERVITLLHRAGLARTPPLECGPRWLKAFQAWLASHPQQAWSRRTVNAYIRHIVAMFRFATEEELFEGAGEIHRALQAVRPVRRGRAIVPGVPALPESIDVQPVSREHVRRIRRHLPTPVRVMMDVQLLTGARPIEICWMRLCDLHATPVPGVFTYNVPPLANKTEHAARPRIVYLGPRVMKLLRLVCPPMDDPSAFVFSPRRWMELLNQRKRESRTLPDWPSHAPAVRRGRRRQRQPFPKRLPGERYSTASYRRAIERACDAAGVPRWTPHQLRHAKATAIANRERGGVELAQILLGHASIETTMRYVKVHDDRAMASAKRWA